MSANVGVDAHIDLQNIRCWRSIRESTLRYAPKAHLLPFSLFHKQAVSITYGRTNKSKCKCTGRHSWRPERIRISVTDAHKNSGGCFKSSTNGQLYRSIKWDSPCCFLQDYLIIFITLPTIIAHMMTAIIIHHKMIFLLRSSAASISSIKRRGL